MAYLELFNRVADHVRRQGVKVTFKRGKPLTSATIERARAKSLIAIPPAMADFYAEVGDGMSFSWAAAGEPDALADFEFPKLKESVVDSIDKVNWRTEWDNHYDFPFTDNPELARQTALRMRKWAALHEEGNGDRFCLDTAFDPAPVVFDQHDWFDGGTGENGHRCADSLLGFFTDWATVCFQLPRGLWWPSVFRADGPGVNWRSPEFREPFRLPSTK
jgi:hypothetical protein